MPIWKFKAGEETETAVIEDLTLSLDTVSGFTEELPLSLATSGTELEDAPSRLFVLDKAYVHWLGGWKYRRVVKISHVNGAGTNYQIKLKIGESSGSNDYDFHLNNHSEKFPSGKNDSGDLRFTKFNENTLIPMWVEKVEGTSPNRTATAWLKIPYDLSSEDCFIFCYYGNQYAWNVSDGEATFDFFDDFDSSSLNTGKWKLYLGSNYSISNSVLHVYSSGGDWTIIGAYSQFGYNHIFEFRAQFTEHNNMQIRADQTSYSGQSNRKLAFANYGSQRFETQGPSGTWYTSRADSFASEMHKGSMAYLSGPKAIFFVDEVQKAQNADSSKMPNGEVLGFQFDVAISGSHLQVDWALVRKFIENELSDWVIGYSPEESSSLILEDLLLNLLAALTEVEDLPLDLYTSYEDLEDLPTHLLASAIKRESFRTWLLASKIATQNCPLYLKLISQSFSNLSLNLIIQGYFLSYLGLDLSTTDGLVLTDLPVDLYVSDGLTLFNLKLSLGAIAPVPLFKGMYFQRTVNTLSEV